MSKSYLNTKLELKEEKEQILPEDNKLAFSYCKIMVKEGDREVKKWALISIGYNVETQTSQGNVKVLEVHDTESDVIDRFKITVAEKLMLTDSQ